MGEDDVADGLSSCVVAEAWLLREIEVANLRLHTSLISLVGNTVLLHLPVSKMDPDGKVPRGPTSVAATSTMHRTNYGPSQADRSTQP